MNSKEQHVKVMRQAARDKTVADLREGRVQRAHVIAPKKGRGSYTRKNKHGGWS